MIKTNDTTSWQEEAGDSILAGLRNKGREKALVIPEVAVAEPITPIKQQAEKLFEGKQSKERAKTFEGSGSNIVDTAKKAYKGVLNVIEESPIPLFGKNSLGTDTLGKVADAIPLFKKALSPEDSVEKRTEEIKKLSADIEERTPDNLTLTQQGFRAALESAPLTAVAMVTSIFGTPAAGLAVMGAYTGSLEFNEAREKGKAYGASLAYGTVQGGIEAFTERLGLGPLMKMFKDKGNGFMTNAIAYGTRELIGENAAEFGQSMTAWYAGLDEALMNPDLSKTDKLILQAQRQYVATIAALAMSGTTTTASATVNNLASQVQTNNEPSIAEGWVKSKATYTRKDKDGNEIEKETGGIKYTRTVYANGEPVLPEKITREKNIKDNTNKEAPANKEGMYSKLEEALLNMKLETNNPQDVMGYFKNNSVVWDEMRDSGMLTFLQESIKEGKPVTRTELMKEFKDNSIMKSYRRETLTPSSEKDVSVFDLLPESDIVTINEYGLEDEANRTRANGRTLNEQEIEDRVAGSSNDMYSEIVGDAINILGADSVASTFDNGRVRGPEILTENLSSNYSQKEIQTLVMSATRKANQELLTNPTTVSDVVTTEEEGKKALNNLITSAKEQGYITYAEMVEILPADYLATEQLEGIIKVLDELDIVVPDKKDIPKTDLPLLRKNKLAQIEYIEKYLPEDLKNDLDTSTKEQARKFLKENPEYVWDVETEEFAYNVVGYDGAYTLTITAKSYGSQGARKMLTKEYSSLNEVQVQMKRHDQSNAVEPVVSGTDAIYSNQLYNSQNLDKKTYKETLIIMDGPEGGELRGGYPYNHWTGINNTVLHLRTSERKDIDGNKVLYIEEIQSDWLEAGERIFGKDKGDLYGMPEFGWRDQEKYRTAVLGLSEKNDEYEATAKELITIFRTNLRRQFPETNNDGTIFNEEIRSQDPYQTDLGGNSFRDFRDKFTDSGASDESSLLKSIYFSDANNIDALVTKFSEAYPDLSNDPYSGIGNIGENKAEALSGFARFFKTFKTVTNSREFYKSTQYEWYNSKKEDKADAQLWLGFLSKKEWARLRNGSDKQEETRAEFIKAQRSVPKMPMKDKWHEFGMRVAVNMAVEGGYKRIAWTNSDEQVRRWSEGSKESARYNEAAGRVIKTPVPEGVNKKMFISLYDKKLPSYAKRLANQYKSTAGKTLIDFNENYTTNKDILFKNSADEYKSSYLDISPEMIEAFKTGRVKFYSKGGLVSRPNTYRRKFAEGGNVKAPIPFTDLKDYVLGQIEETEFGFGKGWIQKEMIKQVNEGFLKLGDNPKQEKIIKFYNNAIPKFEKYLGNETAEKITDAYEVAFDNYFSYEIPGSESETATKVAGASAIAGGGSTLLSKAGEWWNKGKNVRVPGEDTASWKTLLKDSAKQLTRSDAAFKSGKTGLSTLRPLNAFSRKMLGTAPDAATRQLVLRGANFLSKASPVLSILTPSPLADGTLPEKGTPEYIKQMKTSDDMWKNYNNSLLESRQVKSNMANKSDKRDKREGVRQANEIAMQNRERAAQQAATKASNAAKKQAEEHAKAQQQKAQKQKAQEQVYKKTKVGNKGNTGYTGQGNQSRAGNRKSAPAPKPVRRGKNYGVTGKRVTGGR